MSSKKNVISNKLVCVLCLMLLASLCLVFSNNFNVTPSNSSVGSIVTIAGTAQPGSSVIVQVGFEKVIKVSGGSYMFTMQKIVVPAGNNAITVKTTGIQSMSVGLKQIIWSTVTAKVVNGVAILSQSNIATGTYDAVVYGNSKLSSVVLDVTASKTLTADSNGKYSYAYNTAGMPAGVYTVKIGNYVEYFTLK